MLYAKQLAAVSDAEAQAAGQRAVDLARLSQAKITVPPTFVVLSTALARVVSASNLAYKIDYLLARVDTKLAYTLTNAYTGVRKALLDAIIPQDVEREVRELYEAIASRGTGLERDADHLPVRMIVSANHGEDPESNDNVIQAIRNPEEFLLALREAWALAYSPAALAYRLRARFPEPKLAVAVIVQVMRQQDATVHAYSSVPQDRNRIYLQAYRGYPDLREKVAKDYFAINKSDLKIAGSEVRDQQSALLFDEKDALELSPISGKGQAEAIAPRELSEIARLAKKAERELSAPVKAFFASKGDEHELLWVTRLGFDVMIEPESQTFGA